MKCQPRFFLSLDKALTVSQCFTSGLGGLADPGTWSVSVTDAADFTIRSDCISCSAQMQSPKPECWILCR